MNSISPLAHVDPDAKIGDGVTIHPFAFISKNTEIGDGTTIYPYVSILNGARIGKNVKIYNGAIIAAEPQDFRWKGDPGYCYIGNDCIIREHTIINRGIKAEGGTRLGNKVFVMAEAHIMHDVQISDFACVGNGAQVAFAATIDSYTLLSNNSIVNAGSHVGKWVMVKGGCRISGNVPPYTVMAHNPTSYAGVNAMLMRQSKFFSENDIDDIAKAYRHLYESGTSAFNALKRIEQDVKPSAQRDEITNFLKKYELKVVGIPQHFLE